MKTIIVKIIKICMYIYISSPIPSTITKYLAAKNDIYIAQTWM